MAAASRRSARQAIPTRRLGVVARFTGRFGVRKNARKWRTGRGQPPCPVHGASGPARDAWWRGYMGGRRQPLSRRRARASRRVSAPGSRLGCGAVAPRWVRISPASAVLRTARDGASAPLQIGNHFEQHRAARLVLVVERFVMAAAPVSLPHSLAQPPRQRLHVATGTVGYSRRELGTSPGLGIVYVRSSRRTSSPAYSDVLQRSQPAPSAGRLKRRDA